MVDIFNTALYVMITIFVIAVIWLVGAHIIGARMYPMLMGLSPGDSDPGMSRSQYQDTADFMWTGFRWVFYILLAFPFLYLFIKFLYQEEEVSVR